MVESQLQPGASSAMNLVLQSAFAWNLWRICLQHRQGLLLQSFWPNLGTLGYSLGLPHYLQSCSPCAPAHLQGWAALLPLLPSSSTLASKRQKILTGWTHWKTNWRVQPTSHPFASKTVNASMGILWLIHNFTKKHQQPHTRSTTSKQIHPYSINAAGSIKKQTAKL